MLKNLKWLGLAGVILVAAGVGGCTDPITANQDPIMQYPQVHMESYYLQQWTRVQPPITSRVGAGQLHVTVAIRNLTDSDMGLDYKYYFTGPSGSMVENETGWKLVTIPRKGISQIEFTSLSADARDFRVELRQRQ